MARTAIAIGSAPNDGTGAFPRPAGTQINRMFSELYYQVGDKVRLVDIDNGDDGEDGLSWATAFATLAAAEADLGSGGVVQWVGDEAQTAKWTMAQADLHIRGLGHIASRVITNDYNDHIIDVDAADVELASLALVGAAPGNVEDTTGTLDGLYADSTADRLRLRDVYISNCGYCAVRIISNTCDDVDIFNLHANLIGTTAATPALIFANKGCTRIRIVDGLLRNSANGDANGIWIGNNVTPSHDAGVIGVNVVAVGRIGVELWNSGHCGLCCDTLIVLADNWSISMACGTGGWGAVCGDNASYDSDTYGIEVSLVHGCVCMGNVVDTVTTADGGDIGFLGGNTPYGIIAQNYTVGGQRGLQFTAPSYALILHNVHWQPSAHGIRGNASSVAKPNWIIAGNIYRMSSFDTGMALNLPTNNDSWHLKGNISTGTGGNWFCGNMYDSGDLLTVVANIFEDRGVNSTGYGFRVGNHAGAGPVFVLENLVPGFSGAGGDGLVDLALHTGLIVFEGNYVPDAANPITLSGSGTQIVRRNIGFATENKGQATLVNGTTSIAVAHGLAVTPDPEDIRVVPIEAWGSATEFWVDTVGAAEFTINVDADPGQDVDFAWKVER